MSLFNQSTILKWARLSCGFTREELSEDICDVSSLTRYEKGIVNPSEQKYFELLKRTNNIGKRYILPNEMSLFFDEHIYGEFDKLLQKHYHYEIYNKLALIKSGIEDDNTTEYEQFITRLQLLKNKKYNSNYLLDLEKLISKSVANFINGEFPNGRVFNETELHILNDIGIALWEKGEKNKALLFFEKMYEYYLNAVDTTDDSLYIKLLINYSNCLGRLGYFDRSIDICKIGINQSLINQTQNQMHVFLFNIGWNYYMKKDNTKFDKAIEYIEAAMALCNIFDESIIVYDQMKKFYENVLST